MISKNGIMSIYSFLLGLCILLVTLLQNNTLSAYMHDNNVNEFYLFIAYAIIANVLVRIINRGVAYKVSDIVPWLISGLKLIKLFCVTDMRPSLVLGLGHGYRLVDFSPCAAIMETFWMVMNINQPHHSPY